MRGDDGHDVLAGLHPAAALRPGAAVFVAPLTSLALGSVEEHETASAAGLMNFIRTLSGAVATSIVTTVWEDATSYMHAELSGLLEAGATRRAPTSSGLSGEATRTVLDNVTQGSSGCWRRTRSCVRGHRIPSWCAHHLARAPPTRR